jgi:hypothetical protein
MKENYTQLYPNEQVATAVGDYAFNHSTKLPKHISDHHAWGVQSQERANYMISPLQAQFQVWLAKAIGAKRSKSRFSRSFTMLLSSDILEQNFEFMFSLIFSMTDIETLQGSDMLHGESWMGSMK